MTDAKTRPQRVVNPMLETHRNCRDCAPDAEQALCGARLHGIVLDYSTTVTCMVCLSMHTCPSCGRTERS